MISGRVRRTHPAAFMTHPTADHRLAPSASSRDAHSAPRTHVGATRRTCRRSRPARLPRWRCHATASLAPSWKGAPVIARAEPSLAARPVTAWSAPFTARAYTVMTRVASSSLAARMRSSAARAARRSDVRRPRAIHSGRSCGRVPDHVIPQHRGQDGWVIDPPFYAEPAQITRAGPGARTSHHGSSPDRASSCARSKPCPSDCSNAPDAALPRAAVQSGSPCIMFNRRGPCRGRHDRRVTRVSRTVLRCRARAVRLRRPRSRPGREEG